MALARRIGIALVIAGGGLTLAASAPRVVSPGYTYRLKIGGHVVEADGKRTDFVVVSGRAMVTEKGGRLDVDEASKERGAMAEKGAYILFDPTSMMIVSPKDKQIVKFAVDDLEQGIAALAANAPSTRMTISDVEVSLEKLGPGEPMFGLATTKYRLTQDYDFAAASASADRNSTEHVVQDIWVADEKKGIANPFARMGQIPVGAGTAFHELLSKTADAQREMGRGIPLRIVTTTMSMLSRNEVTKTVSTMEVTDLAAGDVDDAALVAPADYQVTDVSAQMKAMAAQREQAKEAQAAQEAREAQASQPAKADSAPHAKAPAKQAGKPAPAPTGTDAAAAEAKQGFVKALHGMVRRP